MQINVTKHQLLGWSREINQLKESILGVFLKGKIQEFLNINQLRIDGINRGLLEIERKYFVYENDEIKIVDGKPVFIEGMTAEAAQKETTEYLQTSVAVTV